MKQHIDDIIKNGETTKAVDLDPQLWQRLERRLDYDKITPPKIRSRRHNNARFLWSRLMVAASVVTIFAMVSGLYLHASKYTVSDLDLQGRPYFSKDEVESVQQYYPILPRTTADGNPDDQIG